MAFDVKINLDWRTVLVIGILFFIYKITLGIIEYSKTVVPSILGYINQQIVSILSDPFSIILVIMFVIGFYIEGRKKY